MKRAKNFAVFGLVGFISFLSGGWLLQRAATDGSVYDRATLFEEVLAHVAEYYVDPIDEAELYDLAIDGMLAELEDPYTNFLREADFRSLRLNTTGNYAGLGIRIDVRDGWITVITPLPETPAERAGLRAGDRIVEVAGESTRGWTSERAVGELTGEAGTTVSIKIQRPGYPELLNFDITRARIHVNSVSSATLLEGDVGYVALSTIAETSAQEVNTAVSDLTDRGARALIFDLRNNPGGLLQQGVAVSDLFLPSGRVVVETRGRAPGSSVVYRTRDESPFAGMPVIVLVNELSASAAEIVAGALQDHDRALIVGRNTFGKGVAQLVFRIGENEALRVTTSRWYTPLGRSLSSARDSGAAVDTVSTVSGRILIGGGTIDPDVEIRSDSLSDAEQGFARALGTNVPVFRDVLTSYAIELKGRNLELPPDFMIDEVMRREVRRRMAERGAELSNAEWAGATQLVNQQLTYELARYLFDRDMEMQRRAMDDVVIGAALELMQGIQTPEELLRSAEARESPLGSR